MSAPGRGEAGLLAGATVAGLVLGCAYGRWVRPRLDDWGAWPEEITARLPGDELLPDPSAQVTRAITIEAPAVEVWPWIVQLGADRGGFYSYDALENLFGLDVHSADHVVAEWQHLAVGDLVAATRSGAGGWYVAAVEPWSALVLQVADMATGEPLGRSDCAPWEFQWTFALQEHGSGWTRLIVRERTAFHRRPVRWLLAPVGPVSALMTRRMLIGVKERVESARAERSRLGTSAGGGGTKAPAPATAMRAES